MSSALLVVDVQNGVVEGIESAATTIATIRELVTAARAHRRTVAWVQHEAVVDDDLPRWSPRWEIVPELVPAPKPGGFDRGFYLWASEWLVGG